MTNSELAVYKKISPNKTSPRAQKPDTITIHCYVGQASVEDMGAWFAKGTAQASSNYGIGSDGRIGMFVEEIDRSWCSSNRDNDNRAITIECASDKTHPYAINDKVYVSLIALCVDICRRNKIERLVWSNNKDDRVNHVNGANMTVHRDYAAKECPGAYIYERLGEIAEEVNAQLVTKRTEPPKTGVTCADLKKLSSDKERAETILEIVRPIALTYNLFPSVIAGQCCLESGFGIVTKLADVNNILGMKSDLINSEWHGSAWDGVSSKMILTTEYINGQEIEKYDSFRAYDSISDCIIDICAFFSTLPKYVNAGILNSCDYHEQLTIEWKKGYATDPNYVYSVERVIKQYNLDRYDNQKQVSKKWYRVGTAWVDGKCKNQKCAYIVLENAVKECPSGYAVFDHTGKVVYINTKSKEQEQIDTACEWAKMIAADDTHGYDNHYPVKDGEYNCIKLVYDAYAQAGIQCQYISCWVADAEFLRVGFEQADVNFNDFHTLKKGDILWRDRHVALYTGENEVTEACGDYDGVKGDSSGTEIYSHSYYNGGWKKCFRLPVPEKSTYRVQTGCYSVKANAENKAKEIKKKTGFDSFIEHQSDGYHLITGSFSVKANAIERMNLIVSKGLDAIIKEK